MVATISFSSMAEWVVGAFIVGLMVGSAITLYAVFRKK